MKHELLYTLGLLVLSVLVFAASPTEAQRIEPLQLRQQTVAPAPYFTPMLQVQTVAPGPYYATPAWDQTLSCATTATCLRFLVLSNMGSNAVLDKETGLVWAKSTNIGKDSWNTAQIHCNQLTVGNRKGWRLPTIQELASLVDPSVTPPGLPLPPGHPFSNVQASRYWSATSSSNPKMAWFVDFSSGELHIFEKGVNLSVWCVRGGQGVDAQ